MAKKTRGFDYFGQFVKQAQKCVQISELLVQHSHNWDERDNIPAVLEQAHEIEHAADLLNHEIYHAAAREFVTPIEREDILEIAHSLDTVIDAIEEVLRSYYMYDARIMAEGTVEFTELIHRACLALEEAVKEFPNFKRAKELKELLIAVNDCEEEGDRIYIQATHDAYAHAKSTGSIAAMGIGQLINVLEKCCDACEDVSDTVVAVIMKNS